MLPLDRDFDEFHIWYRDNDAWMDNIVWDDLHYNFVETGACLKNCFTIVKSHKLFNTQNSHISNILTFHFYTFSVIYTFFFYIAFEELTFYQKCSIKCVLYSLFYTSKISLLSPLIIGSKLTFISSSGCWLPTI